MLCVALGMCARAAQVRCRHCPGVSGASLIYAPIPAPYTVHTHCTYTAYLTGRVRVLGYRQTLPVRYTVYDASHREGGVMGHVCGRNDMGETGWALATVSCMHRMVKQSAAIMHNIIEYTAWGFQAPLPVRVHTVSIWRILQGELCVYIHPSLQEYTLYLSGVSCRESCVYAFTPPCKNTHCTRMA